VDTSVWIDHLRAPDRRLENLLREGKVRMHPLVIGELACGNIANRARRLAEWSALPSVRESSSSEVLEYIEERRLMGRGIGLIDAHLLHATDVNADLKLWTRDRRLRDIAERHGVAYPASR